MEHDDWRRAVVHLEAAADSTAFDRDNPTDSLPTRDVRWTGTALFVQDDDEAAYLITARHVLNDERLADIHSPFRPSREESIRRQLQALPIDAITDAMAKELRENWIAPTIFRVSRFDARGPSSQWHSPSLTTLGSGPKNMHQYTYSDPALDLAVISLRGTPNSPGTNEFRMDLIAHGYVPIPTSRIVDGPSHVGADVCTVGFPGTSHVGMLTTDPAESAWGSSLVSLPVSSWGRVGMDDPALPYFWVDMTIYPGNSGGPVIEGDDVVGVISSQATVENVRVPFALAIKTREVLELLRIQRRKDAFYLGMLRGDDIWQVWPDGPDPDGRKGGGPAYPGS